MAQLLFICSGLALPHFLLTIKSGLNYFDSDFQMPVSYKISFLSNNYLDKNQSKKFEKLNFYLMQDTCLIFRYMQFDSYAQDVSKNERFSTQRYLEQEFQFLNIATNMPSIKNFN